MEQAVVEEAAVGEEAARQAMHPLPPLSSSSEEELAKRWRIMRVRTIMFSKKSRRS